MRIVTTAALALALLVAGVAAACAGSGDGPLSLDRLNPRGTKIKTRSSRFGTVLINADRQTIYAFSKEDGPNSECFGDCARAWPPVLTKAQPRARGETRRGLLGTIERGERKQATYNGHPLYYYAHEGPGQILCQNIDEFGGVWLVVKPNGDPVQ
jgi:predicted lipoprotein with Yx(FWY)xxD motif